MSTRRLPNSNPTRYNAQRTVAERIAVTPPAQIPITAATQARLALFFPDYKIKYLAVEAALTGQGNLTQQVKTAKQQAIYFVDDFIDAMQNAVKRGTFQASVRALYGLPITKPQRPAIITEQDILDWGDQVHEGETTRIAAGGIPIGFPTLAEVDAAVGNFRTLNLQQAAAKDTYDSAQEALDALNAEADRLILKIWNEIETAFDEGNKSSMRRRAREWGVKYVPTAGQGPSPDEFSIQGKVTIEGTATGIADAEVKVVETGETVLTESNGDYLVAYLLPGTYTLEITKAGYEIETITGVVVTAASITAQNISLTAVVVLQGTVHGIVRQAGMPIGGVTVSVEGYPLLTTTTNASGGYNIPNIPAVLQSIRAQRMGPPPSSPLIQTVTVIGGGDVGLDFNF